MKTKERYRERVRKYEEYVSMSFGCEPLCNPGGSGLMQHLQDLSAKVSDLDTPSFRIRRPNILLRSRI